MGRSQQADLTAQQVSGCRLSTNTPLKPSSSSKTGSSKKTINKRKQKLPIKRSKFGLYNAIRSYNQNSVKYSIPKASFIKTVRSIMKNMNFDSYRVTKAAFEAFQEVAEERIMNDFEQLNMLAQHGGRVTVKPVDYETLRRITKFNNLH